MEDMAAEKVSEAGQTATLDRGPREPRVCVIGAGSSGITACQKLLERRVDFDCYEMSTETGGIWRYQNDSGRSAAYRSLHINTSRQMMAYAAYPMPDSYPDYPDHFQIAAYFDDFVDHFGFRDRIQFATEVISVKPVDTTDGSTRWDVTVKPRDGEERTETYTDVIVANGHHWNPRWPEPAFPGSDTFTGEQIHAHYYREPSELAGKRVLVLGIGNSATDISVESSRVAEATFLAMRRGAWIVPKYIAGVPTDRVTAGPLTRAPLFIQSFVLWLTLRLTVGKLTDYGLPKPDHMPLHAHPTVSSDLITRLGHGDITVKPNIDHFDGDNVVFEDGSSEKIDIVVYCTGYQITFPFLDDEILSSEDNEVPLYRHVASIDHPGLFVVGLVQPLGAIMPLAEAQSEWVVDLIEGSGSLPDRSTMTREVAIDQAKMKRRYVNSKRHTIQVDFEDYLRTVSAERAVSRERATTTAG